MHISEGILSAPILVAGACSTGVFTTVGVKKMTPDEIPLTALLSSAFFVASLIHVPLGPTSVHLLLNGLNGILLGWLSFPSILVALFFQAVLFQFGGITVLGVNTFNMAFPALVSYLLFSPLVKTKRKGLIVAGGVLSAFVGVFLAGFFVALELSLMGKAFLPSTKLILLAHIPVCLVEAVITPAVLLYINKVKPEMIENV